ESRSTRGALLFGKALKIILHSLGDISFKRRNVDGEMLFNPGLQIERERSNKCSRSARKRCVESDGVKGVARKFHILMIFLAGETIFKALKHFITAEIELVANEWKPMGHGVDADLVLSSRLRKGQSQGV